MQSAILTKLYDVTHVRSRNWFQIISITITCKTVSSIFHSLRRCWTLRACQRSILDQYSVRIQRHFLMVSKTSYDNWNSNVDLIKWITSLKCLWRRTISLLFIFQGFIMVTRQQRMTFQYWITMMLVYTYLPTPLPSQDVTQCHHVSIQVCR